MEVLKLYDVQCEERHIYYRKKYNAIAEISLPLKVTNLPINFVIEVEPMGTKNVELSFDRTIDYPLLPVIKALKTFILEMDKKDQLTC